MGVCSDPCLQSQVMVLLSGVAAGATTGPLDGARSQRPCPENPKVAAWGSFSHKSDDEASIVAPGGNAL